MFKIRLEDPIVLEEEPRAQLPIPMPKTLAEAKGELAQCEAAQNWERAAALKYAAIPYLERHPTYDEWEDVKPVKKPTTEQAGPVYSSPEMPPWAAALVTAFLWFVMGTMIIDMLLVSLFSTFWGPIVTVRRGPADHTGCLELYLSIILAFCGIPFVWGAGLGLGRWLNKQ